MFKDKKNSLRRSGFEGPLSMGGIMMLFIIGVAMFPTKKLLGLVYKGEDEFVFLLADALIRLGFCGMMVYFSYCLGFRLMWPKSRIIDYIVLIPAVVVAVNTFPFVSFFMGDCQFAEKGWHVAAFALWCVGVGLFEELSFRGIIYPLCLILIKKKMRTARPIFWTVALSSAVFALTHLVNLLNGNIGGTFLQVGYTFLIGSMCGIATAKTGNVLFSALLHIIYNFGGMLMDTSYCGSGVMWTVPQIICTAVVGVIMGGYLIALAFRLDKNKEPSEYLLGEGFEELLIAQKDEAKPQ